ncbi:hypothetical protein SPRG_18413 [Saprolegnia parasitica CBS 223.65]|uniref:Ankyrin repeat protein n=1 Tax=Saprolegnia parasitica (strain CBS 223.65) TaxID=695850 RepID=A0A067BD55_SAPPC|nr:hypothetical protein SPRG_18413 [Saprolegnia parasitica CBS 223.65]KDO16053.1 hypothetical protein SPRG_18413 [Saprolegnia parasitica CBS 223.65]|eukprot:XP_012213239.1 hypothetical protein SPRG_18413 [Saprolegnia parasitica CBS 223.65]
MDAALRDPVLVGLIVVYQNGWWRDSFVFRDDPLLFASGDLEHHVAGFGERFAPWLARRGLDGAMHLMHIYPPLVPCIALHAAATGDHPLGVAAIGSSNDISRWATFMSHVATHFGHCDLFASNGIPVSTKGALTSGNVALVRQLYEERGSVDFNRYVEDAVCSGHLAIPLDVVTKLHEENPTVNLEYMLEEAASNGHCDVIEFILATGAMCTPAALQAAARRGHLACCQVLLTHDCKSNPTRMLPVSVMVAAVAGGNDAIISLLHSNQIWSHEYMNACASVGRLDLVKMLHNAGHFTCSKAAMDCAAANGHVAVVAFLHEHRDEGCSVSAVDNAAGNNHLDVVMYLHATVGAKASCYAIAWAAMGGHDRVVRYLYEAMKAPVLDDVPERAARGGHLSVVRYLHEQGLGEWTPRVMDLAAKSGNRALVAFLHAHRTEGCTRTAVDDAVVRGDVAMVRLLLEVVNATLCSPVAMRQGSADVLVYLASLGVDVVRPLRASGSRFVALVEYLEHKQAWPRPAKKQRTKDRMHQGLKET